MKKQLRPQVPDEEAIGLGEGTELDRLIAGPEALHPGQSGFRLVGLDAQLWHDRRSPGMQARGLPRLYAPLTLTG